jgi:hypothetical protein
VSVGAQHQPNDDFLLLERPDTLDCRIDELEHRVTRSSSQGFIRAEKTEIGTVERSVNEQVSPIRTLPPKSAWDDVLGQQS